MRHDVRSRGLTLLEVVIALAIGGAIVIAAHQLWAMADQLADRLPVEGRAHDARRNGDILLRELLAQIEVGTAPERRFDGDSAVMRAVTWCTTVNGWQERVVLDLGLVQSTDSVLLLGRWGETAQVFWRSAGRGSLDYLAEAGEGGQWLSRWHDAAKAPLAVRAILGRDTLVLRIGERG